MTPSAAWIDRFPGLFEREIAALDRYGYRYQLSDTGAASDVVQVDVVVPVEGHGDIALTATYPDDYPFFRPDVRMSDADAARFEYHVHPIGATRGGVCLLGRDGEQWWPDMTLGWLLHDQLPKVFRTGLAAPEGDHTTVPVHDEVAQAEPISDFYPYYTPGAAVLIDSAWNISEDVAGGGCELALLGSPSGLGSAPALFLARRLFSHGRETVATYDGFPALTTTPVRGDWVRLEAPILAGDATSFYNELVTVHPPTAVPRWQRVGDIELHVVGVTFPEERQHRDGRPHDGWVFLIRTRARGQRGQVAGQVQHHLVRAEYAGPGDLARRVPELAPLAAVRIAVVGLGAIGASIAVHLARAGVGTLVVIDHDHVSAGTLPRYAGSVVHVGWPKVVAVRDLVQQHSPYTTVVPVPYRLGAARTGPSDVSSAEALKALDDAHLIIDATAETNIHHYLAHRTRGLLPLVIASATNGGWGGRVVRLLPTTPACWACLQSHIDDENNARVPARFSPPAAPSPFVQNPGCADRTFTGAGFDIEHVAVQAVRTAVGTVLTESPAGYPAQDGDVFVLRLRHDDGRATQPSWGAYGLDVHPRCPAPHDRGTG